MSGLIAKLSCDGTCEPFTTKNSATGSRILKIQREDEPTLLMHKGCTIHSFFTARAEHTGVPTYEEESQSAMKTRLKKSDIELNAEFEKVERDYNQASKPDGPKGAFVTIALIKDQSRRSKDLNVLNYLIENEKSLIAKSTGREVDELSSVETAMAGTSVGNRFRLRNKKKSPYALPDASTVEKGLAVSTGDDETLKYESFEGSHKFAIPAGVFATKDEEEWSKFAHRFLDFVGAASTKH